MQQQPRDLNNDLLRGVAIVAVVLIHTTADWPHLFDGALLNGFYAFMRPRLDVWISLFLLVSGYYIGKTEIRTWSDYGTYLKRRLSRILAPYALWSFILFLSGFYAGEYEVGDLLPALLFGRLNYPYYFVPIIIKFYLMYPILIFCLRWKWLTVASISGFVLIHVFGPRAFLGFGDQLPLSLMFRRTVQLGWLLFFYVGIIARRKSVLPQTMSLLSLSAGRLVFALFLTSVGMVLLSANVVPLFGTFLFLCANVIPLKQNRLSEAVAFLGRKSYTIYLLHEPSLGFVRSLLREHLPDTSAGHLIEQIPLIVVGFGAPLLYAWIAHKIAGRHARYMVG